MAPTGEFSVIYNRDATSIKLKRQNISKIEKHNHQAIRWLEILRVRLANQGITLEEW
jgi:hypothetical protein